MTRQRALDALNHIPADTDRDTWVRAGMAAHAAGLSFEDFDTWSATGGSYDAAAARDAWRSFKDGKGIGTGTLFRMAYDHGWTDGKKGRVSRVVTTQTTQATQPAPRKPVPGMSAIEVWSRCEPATYDHGYISAKQATGVPLEHLRVVPAGDPLRAAGESMAGALVVPAYGIDGELQSLQLIPPPEVAARLKAKGKPTKLNLIGHPMAGACHVVGNLEPGGVTYICEGIGAAWSTWQATGRAAVVAFGSGNMGRIAAELRAQVDDAKLVLVADAGMEKKVEGIAKEVGATFVTMPEGWEKNMDVNDLALRDGLDALVELLEMTPVKPADKLEDHPLAAFVEFDTKPKAVRWIIPGVVEHGVVTISGARGVGKTTSILPLAMTAAGLHGSDDQLAPKHWRHCVYIVEHVEQAQRIVAGMVEYSNLGIRREDVMERLHIVEARRLDPAHVAQVGKLYRERFTRNVNGVEVLPLVVLDTKAAVLDLSNENDNAEASRAVYALKQGFAGLPTWIIGHIAKSQFGRTDVASLSDRGAGSFEADAIQNIYLVAEDEQRYMLLGKRRFEPKWPELQVSSHMAEVTAYDEWGDPETTTLRWGILTPPDMSRHEAREQAQEAAELERRGDMRQAIMDAVQIAWQAGNPINKTGVRSCVKLKAADVGQEVEALLAEGWLYEVEVPKNQRTNTKRSHFLVRLETPEHDEFMRSGIVPDAKKVIPQSWRRAEIPSVPEVEAEGAEKQVSDA